MISHNVKRTDLTWKATEGWGLLEKLIIAIEGNQDLYSPKEAAREFLKKIEFEDINIHSLEELTLLLASEREEEDDTQWVEIEPKDLNAKFEKALAETVEMIEDGITSAGNLAFEGANEAEAAMLASKLGITIQQRLLSGTIKNPKGRFFTFNIVCRWGHGRSGYRLHMDSYTKDELIELYRFKY